MLIVHHPDRAPAAYTTDRGGEEFFRAFDEQTIPEMIEQGILVQVSDEAFLASLVRPQVFVHLDGDNELKQGIEMIIKALTKKLIDNGFAYSPPLGL